MTIKSSNKSKAKDHKTKSNTATKRHNGVKCIYSVYNLATEFDIIEGTKWYRDANAYAERLAEVYGINKPTIVGVIASLSPRNKWERNKIDAESMVKVFSAGGTFDDLLNLKVCTFSKGKEKAARILSDNVTDRSELLSILKGPKLCEFFNCISDDSDDVCIDGHAYSVWFGDRITLANIPSIGVKLRQTIKADYKLAAQNLGLKPYELQAITWVCWKRIHGV